MTRSAEQPLYHELSDMETGSPPFIFDNVASRVFPLRADAERLKRFCDDYLNIAPPEFSHCRPVLPYVFLAILSYGRMASRGPAAGWASQNEVIFSIPVEWRHLDEEGQEVVELASVTPFLFVDQNLSLITGREVYGWPKVRAWFEPDIRTWTTDAVGRPRPLRMDTLVFPRAYVGRRPERKTLLEIEPDPHRDAWGWPLRFQLPGNPLEIFRQGLEESFRLARDAFRTGQLQAPNFGATFPWTSPGFLWRGISGTLSGALSPPWSMYRLPATTLHLKQFPDTRFPGCASYQAIVSAPMETLDIRGAGLLGTPLPLRGDTSGGFRIRLHGYPEFPIASALGLEVVSSSEVRDDGDVLRGWTRGVAGRTYLSPFPDPDARVRPAERVVVELQPVLPFWADLDLEYGLGRTVCWRSPQTDWSPDTRPGGPTSTRPRLNLANGGIVVPLQGPFFFQDLTLRTLVLRADRDHLTRLVDQMLNAMQDRWRFRLEVPAVLLLAFSFGATESESNDIGWWADREVGFWLLLRGRRIDVEAGADDAVDDRWHTFLTATYVFTNSLLSSLTLRETYGVPAQHGEIESPGHPWMEQAGPESDVVVARVETDMFSAVQTGAQPTQRRVLLEIVESAVNRADERATGPSTLPPADGAVRVDDLGDVREALGQVSRLVFLKQFRDAGAPDRAAYQALVLGQTGFDEPVTRVLQADRYQVRLHRYPSHPIASHLGLEVVDTERRPSSRPGLAWEGRPVDVLRPLEVFTMRTDYRTGFGEDEIRLYPPGAAEE